MKNIKIKIRFSLLFFFCFLLCACPMISQPVCIRFKIKNNTSGMIFVDNGLKADILALPKGKSQEIEYWCPLKIVFPDKYSKEIDYFDISEDKTPGKVKQLFTKMIIIHSFAIYDEKILHLSEGGNTVYKGMNQSILYDEISIVRSKSENEFVSLKIKNNSSSPIKLTSFEAFGDSGSSLQLKAKEFFPITLLPSEKYTLRIPCNFFVKDYSKIEIKTDCPQQPCLGCHIYLSNELAVLN